MRAADLVDVLGQRNNPECTVAFNNGEMVAPNGLLSPLKREARKRNLEQRRQTGERNMRWAADEDVVEVGFLYAFVATASVGVETYSVGTTAGKTPATADKAAPHW